MQCRFPRSVRTLAPLALVAALAVPAGVAASAASSTRATASAAVRAAAPDPGPPGDAFYTPPSPLPAGSPGDVIRARPAKAGPPTARRLADAWQVMYLSTDANGRPNAVTGTVLVPKAGDRAKAPIIGFGPGTEGPAFRCAPSKMIDAGAFYEQSALNEMLAAGYAVAAPDYEGYHAQPKTTYIVGKAMGSALIDAVRAAQRLSESGLSKDAKVVFRGYSQGGGAAMWAGQMQPSYGPELALAGVVGGGVPADIVSVALRLDGKPGFGFVLPALMGLHNAYPELPFDSELNDAGRAAVKKLEDGGCTLELLLDYQNKRLKDFFVQSPLRGPWLTRATENRLGQAPIKVPVLQYHSRADEIVNYNQASLLHDDYCALGMNVTWKPWESLSHITLVHRGNADAMAFIADRLAGKPATGDCPAAKPGG